MTELKNVFRYSVSRDQCHATCPRQYYFQYYGSWGGWKRDAPAQAQRLYLLKRLSNLPTWAGSTVHQALYDVLVSLQRHRLPTLDESIAAAAERMREEYNRSERGAYRTNRKALGLIEHERRLDVPPESKREVWDHVKNCLANFYASEIFEELRNSDPSQWLLADDPGGDFDPQSIFEIDGLPIIAKPDLVFAQEPERVRIIDWKTGKPDDEQVHQVTCYALFVHEKLKIDFDHMELELHFLAESNVRRIDLDSERLERSRRRIQDRSRELLELLDDPENAVARERDFPRIEKARICDFCSFYPVCWD